MQKKQSKRIRITGKRQPRIAPSEVAKALNAKPVSWDELPESIKRAHGAAQIWGGPPRRKV
nr:hypothetical protein 1 [Candidatus Omnitrophota bacterium]